MYKYVSNRKFGIVVNELYDNHLKDGGVIQLHYKFGDSWCGKDVNFNKWLKGKYQKVELRHLDSTYLLRKPRNKVKQKETDNEML